MYFSIQRFSSFQRQLSRSLTVEHYIYLYLHYYLCMKIFDLMIALHHILSSPIPFSFIKNTKIKIGFNSNSSTYLTLLERECVCVKYSIWLFIYQYFIACIVYFYVPDSYICIIKLTQPCFNLN